MTNRDDPQEEIPRVRCDVCKKLVTYLDLVRIIRPRVCQSCVIVVDDDDTFGDEWKSVDIGGEG